MLRKTHSILQWLLAVLLLYVLVTRAFVSWVQFSPESFITTVESLSDTQINAEQIVVEQSWDGFALKLKNFSIVDRHFVLQAAKLEADINLFSLFIPSLSYGDSIKIHYGAYQNRQEPIAEEQSKPLNLQQYIKVKAVTAHLWKRIELKSFVLSEFARPGFILQLHDFQSINGARFSVVSEFSLAYKNILHYERFNFTALLDNDIWGSVKQGRFSLSSFSPLSVGNLSKMLSQNWQSVLPKGELLVDLEGHIKDSQVVDLRTNLNTQMLVWPQQGINLPDSLGLQFDWLHQNQLALSKRDDWKIWLSKIQIDNRFIDSVSPVELYYDGGDNLEFNAQYFELEPFQVVLKSLIKNPHIAAFFDQAAFLKVSDVTGKLDVETVDIPELSVKFERLDVPVTEFPGMSVRELQVDKDSSGISLRTEKPIWVMAPDVHNRPMRVLLPVVLRFNYLSEQRFWQLPEVWLDVNNAKLKLEAKTISNADIDISFAMQMADMKQLKQYLPYSLMSENLATWLQEALVSGQNIELSGQLKGAYSRFPFKDGSGVFEMDARVKNASLNFDKDWPALKGVDANIHFKPYSLEIGSAEIELAKGVSAKDVRVQIPDLDKGDVAVVVQGQVVADAESTVKYLTRSPLATTMGLDSFLSSRKGFVGNVKVDLSKLWIPVSGYQGVDTQVSGQISLDRVGFDILKSLPVTNLNADLGFSEKTVDSDNLRFKFAGGNVKGTIKTRDKASGLLMSLKGRMFESPNHWFKKPLDWQSSWTIPIGKTDAPLKAKTNFYLAKAESLMPEPLNAAALQNRVLSIDTDFVESTVANHIRLEGLLDAQAIWKKAQKTSSDYSLTRLNAVLGGGKVNSKNTFSSIKGVINELDIGHWIPLISDYAWASDGQESGVQVLQTLNWHENDVKVKNLSWLGQSYQNQSFDWINLENIGIQIRTTGNYLQGVAKVYQDTAKPINIDIDKLVLKTQESKVNEAGPDSVSAAKEQSGQCEVNIEPSQNLLPDIDVTGRNIIFNGRKIDRLNFKLEDKKQALKIQEFKGEFASGAGQLTGDYSFDKFNQFSTMGLELNSNNVSGLAEFIKLNKGFTGKKAQMTMALNWYGGLDCLTAKTVNGSVGFDLKDGSIEDVEPGIARLIGLLSVESLVRRLSLDLKDVTNKGMVYDRIKGQGKIDHGKVNLTKFELNAPSAEVLMDGNIDLIAEQFNLKAKVTPKIGATVPTIAALAGSANPLAALAIYTLMKVIPGVNENLVTYDYKITGPWREPLINGQELKPEQAK